MSKAELNYIMDISMAVSFIIIAITGLILFFFLPSGVRQGGYQEFLGIIKQVWINVHNFFGIILIIFVLIHLALHWNWIFCMTKTFFLNKCEKNKYSKN